MATVAEERVVSLKVNRDLLNANFDGYKISLTKLLSYTVNLEKGVHTVQLSADQYSFSHSKAFGIINHVFVDYWSESSSIYVIDSSGNICKVQLTKDDRAAILSPVFPIPNADVSAASISRCNISLQFVSSQIAVTTDHNGVLYIISTGDRAPPAAGNNADHKWKCEYSGDCTYKQTCGKLVDGVSYSDGATLDLCMLYVVPNPQHHISANHAASHAETHAVQSAFQCIIRWITMKRNVSTDDDGRVDWVIYKERFLCGQNVADFVALHRRRGVGEEEEGSGWLCVCSETPYYPGEQIPRPQPAAANLLQNGGNGEGNDSNGDEKLKEMRGGETGEKNIGVDEVESETDKQEVGVTKQEVDVTKQEVDVTKQEVDVTKQEVDVTKQEADVTKEEASDGNKEKCIDVTWSESDESVSLSIPLAACAGAISKHDVSVSLTPRFISVSVNSTSGREETGSSQKRSKSEILSGMLFAAIEPTLSTYVVDKIKKTLEVMLWKEDECTEWKSVLLSHGGGEGMKWRFINPDRQKEGDTGAQSGPAADVGGEQQQPHQSLFNMQQELEECDEYPDETAVLQVFTSTGSPESGESHSHEEDTVALHTTVPIDGNKWLLNMRGSDPHASPYMCLRHDVDGIVWQMEVQQQQQPREKAPSFKHVHTLDAFGYIQAAKEQRKFTLCAPDASYYCVCDATRHIYVYRKPAPEQDMELRNRKTGQMVDVIGKSHVISLDTTDTILGVHCSRNRLFAITERHLYIIHVNE